jgi:beta-N-acetylhexosaminidase
MRVQSMVSVLLSSALVASLLVSVRPVPAPPAIRAAADPPVAVSVAEQAPDLGNLQADVGAVLVVSWRGTNVPPGIQAMLDDGRVGGVLLFSSNFNGPAGLKALTETLRALPAGACLDHPILVMLDQEGGQVVRVKADFAPPSAQVFGAGGADHVRAVERASAAGLRELGVGLNLAPVADVRTNPNDQVILDRSFGSNPSAVAPLVAAAVEGLHDGGVGATLKHFPGLGGSAGDPHVAIPTDPQSEAQWERVQKPAFQAGIAAGADAVMTTAMYVPGLGGGNTPAMFSAAVVSRLRTQMGFEGVIMSDSVSMAGVGNRYSLPEATILALAAGNDMVLLANGDPGYQAEAMAAVTAAVASGRLDRAKLHVSAMRVNKLRDRWGRRFTHCRPIRTA